MKSFGNASIRSVLGAIIGVLGLFLIAQLASGWGIEPAPRVRSPKLVPEQHWQDLVRGMVREAPLPSLIVAFLVGVLVARR